MGTAESLAAWGILRAADVVDIAAGVGLHPARAAALFQLESGARVGTVWTYGHNIWGHDAGSTGGTYQKGGPVTQATYAAYRAALANGTAGRQGVGPCQLTAEDYQAQADRLGGCWRWEVNAKVGFALLVNLIGRFGERDGYVAYNGGPGAVINRSRRRNDAAEEYGDKAVAALAAWRTRLGSSTVTPPPPPATAKDWFDMATRDDLRAVLLEVLGPSLDPKSPTALAQRADVGFVRDQTAAVIDFNPTSIPADLAKGPSVLGLLHQLVTHQSDPADVEPLDYNRLARAMVAVLMEAASAHQASADDPSSTSATPPL